jgi:hypothetical protein
MMEYVKVAHLARMSREVSLAVIVVDVWATSEKHSTRLIINNMIINY